MIKIYSICLSILSVLSIVRINQSIDMCYVPEKTEPTIEVIVAESVSLPREVDLSEYDFIIPEEEIITSSALGLSPELEMTINEYAEYYDLDPALVRAVIWVESRGKIDADNGLCVGLMQLNTQYADNFYNGAEISSLYDPVDNIKGGCWFLSELMEMSDNNEVLALMSYNLGASKAKSYWSEGIYSTKYSDSVLNAKLKFIS